MTASAIITLVQQHITEATMASSAAVCVASARWCLSRGDEASARRQALKALAYCVGVLHPAYAAAAAPVTTGA